MKADKIDLTNIKELSEQELIELAEEIRSFLIKNVSLTGGHLSSNLGVVELTIALHRVFSTPKDQIIWDVGHQSYVHKILSGRRHLFDKLRMRNGLSGYPSPSESEHDFIHAGHSSTSLSIAAGAARAKRLLGDTSATIAVIGDGAFTAGMVYEALNTISHERLPVLIVLNDNGMSISKNVGGISSYFKKLRSSKAYFHFKRRTESFLEKIPLIGKVLKNWAYQTKERVKEVFVPGRFFQDIGIQYMGPIDGHDIVKLESLFKEVKDFKGPIMIHVITQKGRGYKPSEEDPCGFHGISAVSDEEEQGLSSEKKSQKSFSSLLGETLCEIAAEDSSVFAITAAMAKGTGLSAFAKKFPERFSDVGIAEQHAVTYALGLALLGFKPVVCIYSTFLQRAFDQLVHDIGIAQKGVLFCLDRAGLVPDDGETHQGIFDLAYLKMIPGFQILVPSGASEFRMMLRYALQNLNSPIAIRYPKEEARDHPDYDPTQFPIRLGEAVEIKNGKDIQVLVCGTLLYAVMEARKILEKEKIFVKILNLRFVKPINKSVFENLMLSSAPVLVLEEGISSGGVGQEVVFELQKRGARQSVYTLNLGDRYPLMDSRAGLLEEYGLTTDRIVDTIRRVLSS